MVVGGPPPYRTYRFPIGPCQLTPTPVLLTRSLIRPRRSLTHSPQLTPTPFLLTRPPIHSRQLTIGHSSSRTHSLARSRPLTPTPPLLLTHSPARWPTHSLTSTHPDPAPPPWPSRSLAHSPTPTHHPTPPHSPTPFHADSPVPQSSHTLTHSLTHSRQLAPIPSSSLAHSLSDTNSPLPHSLSSLTHPITPTHSRHPFLRTHPLTHRLQPASADFPLPHPPLTRALTHSSAHSVPHARQLPLPPSPLLTDANSP